MLPPTPNPNASRWNIGGVGSPTQNSCVGHVDFMLFVSMSFALGSQREPSIQWNMGLKMINSHMYTTIMLIRHRQMHSWNQHLHATIHIIEIVFFFFFFFLIVCFTSYFVFSSIAVLLHSPGVVYYHLLLRRETRIPGVTPFSFRIGIWDLFVHRGQKSYTPTAFGKLWTTPGVRCMQHASS